MDQAAALRCRVGHALLLDCRDGSIAQVPFDLSAHGLSLLIMDTRAEHTLVDGQYAQRRDSYEEAARQLGPSSLREVAFDDLDKTLDRLSDITIRARARHVVTEIERVRQTVALLRAGRLPAVGPLFDASHASMRDDFEISCAELDVAVEVARAHGALGARMTEGVRRFGHRPGAHRARSRGDLGRHTCLCGQGLWCPRLLRGRRRRTRPARVLTPSHWGRGHVLVDDNDRPIPLRRCNDVAAGPRRPTMPRSVRADVTALLEVPRQTPPPHDRCATAMVQNPPPLPTPTLERARVVCGRSEVVETCLKWAIESGQETGVWGGLSSDHPRTPHCSCASPPPGYTPQPS